MTYEEAFPRGRVTLQQFDKTDWRVAEEFWFYWAAKGITVTVWKEFLTDHASIPPIVPDYLIDNTGPISNGAVPHDMIYKLLAHSKGIPFRCMYDMLSGRYWTKKEADHMFHAANIATGEMGWLELRLAQWVVFNLKAKWEWMSKKEWDKQVILMRAEAV